MILQNDFVEYLDLIASYENPKHSLKQPLAGHFYYSVDDTSRRKPIVLELNYNKNGPTKI